jgi:hypothetical protein
MWRSRQLLHVHSFIVSFRLQRPAACQASRTDGKVIFTTSGKSYPVNRAIKLFCIDANNADFWINTVPIRRHSIKNQPEIAAISWLQGGR